MMAPRRRRIVVLLAAFVVVALTTRLGFWQLDRAAQKAAMQSAIDERGRLPNLGAHDLAQDEPAAADQHHRPVRLRGRWLADKTVVLDNRPMNGRAGFIVITPLLLDPGPGAVLVQRGWLARDGLDRTSLPVFTTPSGLVDVVGHLAAAPSRLFELGGPGGGPHDGPIRQNLDLADYAREIQVRLTPMSVLESDSSSTVGDGLLRQWPRPSVDIHKNYGYAAQWFALAALTAGLYIWFQFIQPRRGRAG